MAASILGLRNQQEKDKAPIHKLGFWWERGMFVKRKMVKKTRDEEPWKTVKDGQGREGRRVCRG